MSDDDFAELMLESQQYVFAAVWAAIRCSAARLARQDVEELIQEANLHIWRQRGKYDPARGSLCNWAWQVAFNRASDIASRLARLPTPSELKEVETSADDPSVWDGLEHRLGKLQKWERALVTAYHLITPQLLNDWARMLGMTRKALDVRVCRIRKALLD